MSTCDHGGCQTPASHTITAAYPGPDDIHPLFHTYPAPMHRACRFHLAALIDSDGSNPGATPAYLVRSIT